MKKKLVSVMVSLSILFCTACGAGKSYTCSECGETTTDAYYTYYATEDEVLCEDCARKYWMPLPYENYKVK